MKTSKIAEMLSIPDRRRERTLYLHVGHPKTGTTAIQVALKKFRRHFEQSGIWIPEIGQMSVGNHHPIASELVGLPPPIEFEGALGMLEQRLAREKGSVLISSEALFNQCNGRPGLTRKVFDRLNRSGFEVRVIMYVRDFCDFLNSAYQQGVCNFNVSDRFCKYATTRASREPPILYWVRILNEMRIGHIIRPYSSALNASSLLEDFCLCLGVSAPSGANKMKRMNSNRGLTSVLLARHLTRTADRDIVHDLVSSQGVELVLALEKFVRRVPNEPYKGLSSKVAEEINRRSRADRDDFARIAWGCRWKDMFGEPDYDDSSCNDPAEIGLDDYEPIADLFPKFEKLCRPILEQRENISPDDRRQRTKGRMRILDQFEKDI